MSLESRCQRLISDYRARPTLRAGSLITTVFGDAIAPRGGVVWLGSLIRAMAGLGISERLVRTSVYRLVKDGWLRSEQIGRRSYYSLTGDGRDRFRQATHRIYGEPSTNWDGEWCWLLLSGLSTADKDQARRELSWLGFGALSPNVLAHPSPNAADLQITMRRLGIGDRLVVMHGQTVHGEAPLRDMVHASWNLDDIDARYETFVATFQPIVAAIAGDTALQPQTAFLLRTLLIQEYRKALLRDPQLPDELQPSGWHGTAAYQVCRNLYRRVWDTADTYLDDILENADGPLPPVDRDYLQRFGGLQRANG